MLTDVFNSRTIVVQGESAPSDDSDRTMISSDDTASTSSSASSSSFSLLEGAGGVDMYIVSGHEAMQL